MSEEGGGQSENLCYTTVRQLHGYANAVGKKKAPIPPSTIVMKELVGALSPVNHKGLYQG